MRHVRPGRCARVGARAGGAGRGRAVNNARMKRLELLIGALVLLLVVGAMVTFFTIPRAGPVAPSGSASGAADTPEVDPARRLWAADPGRSVYVFGEAVRPGAHEIPEGETWTPARLLEAVGGFGPSAQGQLRVVRKVNGAITEILKLSKEAVSGSELKLEPGDVIYVD